MLRTRARARGGVYGVSATPVTPSLYKAVLDGDSLSSSQIWSVSSTNTERRAAGYWTNAAAQLYQMFSTRYAQGYGASGNKIADILSGAATVISYVEANSVDAIFLMLGANDVEDTGRTTAAIIADYETLLTDYRDCSNSPYVFVGNMTPRGDWEADLEATRATYVTRLHELRDGLETVVAGLGNKVILWDAWDDIVNTSVTNPTTGLNYFPKTGYMATDGVHLSHWGAHWAGKRCANAVKATALWGAPTALPSTTGAVNTNPSLSGTSGTNGTASSGTVASNCRVERSAGTAATATNSKETTTIFGISQETQKIVISGGTAAVEEFFFYMEYPEPARSMSGSVGVEMMCPIKITAATGVLGVYLYGRVTQGSTYTNLDMAYTSGNYLPVDDLPIEWLLRNEPLLVPAGTSTRYQMVVRIRIDGTVSSNGVTVNIGQCTVKELTP